MRIIDRVRMVIAMAEIGEMTVSNKFLDATIFVFESSAICKHMTAIRLLARLLTVLVSAEVTTRVATVASMFVPGWIAWTLAVLAYVGLCVSMQPEVFAVVISAWHRQRNAEAEEYHRARRFVDDLIRYSNNSKR